MVKREHANHHQEFALFKRVAEQALARFGIRPASLRLLSRFCNTTYDVRAGDGSRYALHIYRTFDPTISTARRKDWIESELWWLDHVRRRVGVRSPEALSTPEGDRVLVVSDGREPGAHFPCVLFRWMEGRFLRSRFAPHHLRQVGRLTARLHEDSSRLTVPHGFCRGLVDAVEGESAARIIEHFGRSHGRKAAAITRKTLKDVREARRILGSGGDAFGLIHADIHYRNFLFNGGEVGLLDFGDCGWGHYVYDLAVTINTLPVQPGLPELAAALLAGYREIRDLPPQVETHIQTFRALRQLQDSLYQQS